MPPELEVADWDTLAGGIRATGLGVGWGATGGMACKVVEVGSWVRCGTVGWT